MGMQSSGLRGNCQKTSAYREPTVGAGAHLGTQVQGHRQRARILT